MYFLYLTCVHSSLSDVACAEHLSRDSAADGATVAVATAAVYDLKSNLCKGFVSYFHLSSKPSLSKLVGVHCKKLCNLPMLVMIR